MFQRKQKTEKQKEATGMIKSFKNILTKYKMCDINKKNINILFGKPVEMQGRKVNGPNPFLRNGSRLLFGDSVSDVF